MISGSAFGGLATVTQNDIVVMGKINPGIRLLPSGSEPGAQDVAYREIGGAGWWLVNADLNTAGQFFQVDNTKMSSAIVLYGNGTVSINTAPAGTTGPITWSSSSLQSANPFFYVGNYGAPTDGVTDSWTAWNNAIAAATANGGGTVLGGPYNYALSAMLEVNAPEVNVMGMGQGTTILTQTFMPSAQNPAILLAGPSSNGCEFTHLTLKGPGNSATGTLPGPTTLTAPSVGTGWGFLNFGGSANKVEFVTASGIYHAFGGIIFSNGLSFQNCTANMGGQQMTTQYAVYCQGRSGSAATAQYVVSGTPTNGDTVGFILDDGQGNVIDTGTYQLTAGDQSGGVNQTAVDLQNFLNDSAAVVGPIANWNNFAASGPDINGSIDIPTGASTPTFRAYTTGGVVVTPITTTQVTGGTAGNNQSFPFSVKSLSCPQAQFNPAGPGSFASTEAVHIDGGVNSWQVDGIGTTGCFYGVRVANVNSGNDRNSTFGQIQQFSFDHTRQASISLENGVGTNVHDGQCIANFGQGSPINNWAINVAPTYGGGAEIYDVDISNCASGGIGIGANTRVFGCHIVAVGKGAQSCINLQGTQPITGVTIKGCKLGTPNLANTGLGTQKWAIDLALWFTSTVQSLTIMGNDCQGRHGPINCGTIIHDSYVATGANTNIVIKANPGIDPLNFTVLGTTKPTIPTAGSSTPAVNSTGMDCLVTITPDGTHAVTSVQRTGPNGTETFTTHASATQQVVVPCFANEQILPVYSAGTAQWEWTAAC